MSISQPVPVQSSASTVLNGTVAPVRASHLDANERVSLPWIVLTGDCLRSLTAIRFSSTVKVVDDIQGACGAFRAAVIGVDLSHVGTRGAARRVLQNRVRSFVAICDQLPQLAHIFLVTGSMPRTPERWLISAGDAVGGKAHALIEQSWGRYVAVTVIAAGHCDNPDVLAEWITRRARRAPGFDASVALTWDEVEGDVDAHAGINQFL